MDHEQTCIESESDSRPVIPKNVSDEQSDQQKIEVLLRLKPLKKSNETTVLNIGERNICISHPSRNIHTDAHSKIMEYQFDCILPETSTQNDTFQKSCPSLLNKFLSGENALLFSYGPSGSGKTYTIQGNQKQIGIIPRLLQSIFRSIDEDENKRDGPLTSKYYPDSILIPTRKGMRFTILISYLECYNERIYDLLKASSNGHRTALSIKEDKNKHIFIKDLLEQPIKNVEQAKKWLDIGMKNRKVGQTFINQDSSRSHSIFTIKLAQIPKNVPIEEVRKNPSLMVYSKFSIVDLAGSERSSKSRVEGNRMREAGNINNSLMTLGKCMEIMRYNQLWEGKEGYESKIKMVPFRESKLTRMFQDFFLGNGGKAVMVVNVSTDVSDYDQTTQALSFATTAKNVVPTIKKQHIPSKLDKEVIQPIPFMLGEVEEDKMKEKSNHVHNMDVLKESKIKKMKMSRNEEKKIQNGVKKMKKEVVEKDEEDVKELLEKDDVQEEIKMNEMTIEEDAPFEESEETKNNVIEEDLIISEDVINNDEASDDAIEHDTLEQGESDDAIERNTLKQEETLNDQIVSEVVIEEDHSYNANVIVDESIEKKSNSFFDIETEDSPSLMDIYGSEESTESSTPSVQPILSSLSSFQSSCKTPKMFRSPFMRQYDTLDLELSIRSDIVDEHVSILSESQAFYESYAKDQITYIMDMMQEKLKQKSIELDEMTQIQAEQFQYDSNKKDAFIEDLNHQLNEQMEENEQLKSSLSEKDELIESLKLKYQAKISKFKNDILRLNNEYKKQIEAAKEESLTLKKQIKDQVDDSQDLPPIPSKKNQKKRKSSSISSTDDEFIDNRSKFIHNDDDDIENKENQEIQSKRKGRPRKTTTEKTRTNKKKKESEDEFTSTPPKKMKRLKKLTEVLSPTNGLIVTKTPLRKRLRPRKEVQSVLSPVN